MRGFTTPLFLCLRLAQVPSVWNTTRNVWNIRETPVELMHGASVVWNLAWNKFAAAV